MKAGAMFSGYTTEQNTFGAEAGQFPIAALFGSVIRQRINFTKTYSNGPSHHPKILYDGSISEDGFLIYGTWKIHSMQKGTFKMTRAVEQEPKARVVTEEELVR